ALIAAAGEVGKSFLLLALAREVAAFDGIWANAPTLFGGALANQGVAIYVTAEDDAIEVHNRLNALGPIPDSLYVLPLPDAGGAVPLFAPDPVTRGPSAHSGHGGQWIRRWRTPSERSDASGLATYQTVRHASRRRALFASIPSMTVRCGARCVPAGRGSRRRCDRRRGTRASLRRAAAM